MNGKDYRRDLPHKFPDGASVFVTWRLEGSLPVPSDAENLMIQKLSARESLVRVEKLLDAAVVGPVWLTDPRIAELVCGAIEEGQNRFNRYRLHAYVVMSNHVHVLITPHHDMATIMNQLKGVTARRANQLLGMSGERFWQRESFDRWCRDEDHFFKVWNYIRLNPVKVGLAKTPEGYRWGSAYRGVEQGI